MSALWMMVCLSVTAVLVCKIWRITDPVLSAILVAVIVLHPYQADIYTWKIALFVGGLPFVLALLAILLAQNGWRQMGWGVAVLWFSLGGQQLGLTYAASAVALTVFIAIAQASRENSNPTWEFARFTRSGLVLLIGTAIYWITSVVIIRALGVGSLLGREQIILFSDPGLVWARTMELAGKVIGRDPLVSPAQIGIIAILIVIALCSIAFHAFRNQRGRNIPLLIGLAVTSLALGWLATIALMAVPKVWIPVFRNMSAAGVVVAAVVAGGYLLTSGAWRKVVIGLAALLCFGFAGKSNEIMTDQLRANQRDQTLMVRIAYDVEKLETFKQVTRLYFVGKTGLPLTRLDTQTDPTRGRDAYGVTMSVLANAAFDNIYPVMLFNELTGYFFGSALNSDEVAVANQRCTEAEEWPRTGSVSTAGDIAIICLGKPLQPTRARLER
jgi:hypothetical protein